MLKRLKKYLGITFGLVSSILVVIIFLNPPTDFDGGPMLAYNFLFFFPMLIVAGILSLITIILSIIRFAKYKGLNIISIVLSIPGLIYFALILLVFLITSTEPEPIERPDQIHNNSESIVLDGKTLHLTGFNFGKDYKRKIVYISGIPYFNKSFQKTDAYFCQGNSKFELFYSNDSDSLWVYISQSEPMYHDINGKNLDKIPVRAIQLTDRQIDSLMNLVSDKIKRFEWEEITEPNTRYKKLPGK
jgi:hypothetical protein